MFNSGKCFAVIRNNYSRICGDNRVCLAGLNVILVSGGSDARKSTDQERYQTLWKQQPVGSGVIMQQILLLILKYLHVHVFTEELEAAANFDRNVSSFLLSWV